MSKLRKQSEKKKQIRTVKQDIEEYEKTIEFNNDELELLVEEKDINDFMMDHTKATMKFLEEINYEIFNPKDTLEASPEWLMLKKIDDIQGARKTLAACKKIRISVNKQISKLEMQNERVKENIAEAKKWLLENENK